MPCWPVSLHEGRYQARDQDGQLHPISFGGEPVTAFQPGWEPVGLQTGLPPFHLLELRRDDGPARDAVWYLDHSLAFAGNALQTMPPHQSGLLRDSLAPLLRAIRDRSLCAEAPVITEAGRAFGGINPVFVRDLVTFVAGLALPAPQVVPEARFEDVLASIPKPGMQLSAPMLRRSLALGRADISVVSPFTGSPLAVQEAFAFGEHRDRAWRCHDPAGEATLYLLASADGSRALYIPALNAVFSSQDDFSGARVLAGLLTHYAVTEGQVTPPPVEPEARPAPDDWLTRAASAVTVDETGDRHDAPAGRRKGWMRRLFRAGQPAETDGQRRKLRRGAEKFAALAEGWSAVEFQLAATPLLVVSLRHRDGATERWVIDEADQVHSGPLTRMPVAVQDILRAGTRLLRARDPAGESWRALPRPLRLEMLAADRAATALGAGARLEVRADDKLISVLLADGTELPVLTGASPLSQTDLQPGWTAESLYRDFAPFHLLELRHENGARAAWLLDQQLGVIDDLLLASAATKDALLPHAARIMNHHVESVLAFADPAQDPVVARYLDLDPSVRLGILGHAGCNIRPPLEAIGVRVMGAVLPTSLVTTTGNALALRRDIATDAATTDLHERTLRGIADGIFTWPSPVDGSETPLCGIFTLDEYVFLYQFVDRNGVDFLLVAGDRSARLIGLVLPMSNLFLFDNHVPQWMGDTWLRGERGGDFWFLLVRHVNQYADEMAHRARTRRARPVNVLLAAIHIGHHLWNDLTGLEALCRVVDDARLPTTMILGAADGHAELFGPIDTLFPQLAGHVDRSLPGVDAFIRMTYRADVWPCRVTRDHVSVALRTRVNRLLDQTEAAGHVRAFFARRAALSPAPPVVIFGLRVEDRTFVDLQAFCMDFVAFMAERHPGAILVFDGYNCGPAAGVNPAPVIRGMAYHLARRPPEAVEREIIDALTARFAQAPVTIIGTTGQSIAASLAWCHRADAAFAIWGAGLAKYRWLANLPTMMISTHANLLGRPDLAIYQDARFTEAPAPYRFVDASLVTDAGAEGALAPGHVQGGRGCFTANNRAVLLGFGDFLDQVRAVPP